MKAGHEDAQAGVAELVDARDLGSRDESRGGSRPSARTTPAGWAEPDRSRPDGYGWNGGTAMQVTETLAEGLKREYRVVVPAADLDAKVNARLLELKDRVHINGFRPGKVPVAHLRRIYGKAVMAEAIEEAVREANSSIVSDRGFKLAIEPKVVMPETAESIGEVVAGKADLAYSIELEILPKIELADFKDIRIEKPVAPVTDEEVTKALDRLVEQNRPFAGKGEGGRAAQRDRVTVSFAGTIDGAPFAGGTDDDVRLLIAPGSFLPGFEDQLIGAAAGESRTVRVTLPESYVPASLAGKEAVFEVIVKAVDALQPVTLDDAFAQSLGIDSLERLREGVREQLARDHGVATRLRMKRALLDRLDERYTFELPATLVEQEFSSVWRALVADLEAHHRTFADEGTTEESARADYRKIAERRIRLGLVIAEIGERNDIKVTEDEVRRAVVERARQLPGHEQQVWDYYRKTPSAIAAVRAPLYEEKVVDFLLELVAVSERKMTTKELFADNGEAAKQGGPAAP
jgi:trigger factor